MNFHDQIDVIAGLTAIVMFIAAVVKFFSIEEKDRNRYLNTATYLAVFCCCLVFLFGCENRRFDGESSSTFTTKTTPEDSTSADHLPASTFDREFNGQQAGEQKTLGSMKKLKVCWCPAGSFTMGSQKSKQDRDDDDEDQVKVTLSQGFWMGEHEVTQSLWEGEMSTTPWKGQLIDLGDEKVKVHKEGDDYPAVYISHNDAMKFCEKLTRRGHQEGWMQKDWKVSLPTEAQWEYACRAGTTTAYHFGNDRSKLGEYAWYDENADDVGEDYAHEVGQKNPNGWNLYDMHGNVWEWCLDWYDEDLPGSVDPVVTKESSNRVIRGGSWFNSAMSCRSADRGYSSPGLSGHSLGFRICVVPIQSH